MSKSEKELALEELLQIPGLGTKIADDLWNLGIRSIRNLKDQDPEVLYSRLQARKGVHVDRCVLYIFRCAVYYASTTNHNPELLKWWNWKDERR